MSDASLPPTGIPPTAPQLSETARRKLRVWRVIVKISLTITWACLAIELALFLWPEAPRILRIVIGALLAESFLTTVLIGAAGRCPMCSESFTFEAGRLTPDSCRSCGVVLK